RLLRLYLLLVDRASVLDGVTHRIARDLVKEHALDRDIRRAALRFDLQRDVGGDGLALTIGVGGDEDFTRIPSRALQLRDRLFLSGNRNELRFEALDVDAELLLRQVHDVADGRTNAVSAAEVFADGLRLRGRFDDDER